MSDENTVTLRDRRGRKLVLPAKTTLAQLLKMGFSRPGLAKPDAPMKKNEWRAV